MVLLQADTMKRKLTVNLDHERLDNIVPDHLEVGVTNPVRDLVSAKPGTTTHGSPGTGEEVVEDGDLVTEEHETIDQVRSDESSTTSD
jgi:hypothetical protein